MGATMRVRAKNPRGSHEYFCEPYTLQHFGDFLVDRTKMLFIDIPTMLWEMFRYATSRKVRKEWREQSNWWLDIVPPEQVMVFGRED